MGYNRALSGSTFTRSELKTGKRPPPKNIKTFPPGTPLFKENEVGRELFIVSEGGVKITKGERDDEVELATLGPGAILGEMSLLDKQPRSATATTTELTKAVIINEATFNAVANLLPIWLTSIIRIITSRLRDTNKSIGTSILKNREKGICHLVHMLAMQANQGSDKKGCKLEYYEFISEVQFITKLKKGDVELGLNNLASKSLLKITTEPGAKYIEAEDINGLKYYVEYLFKKEQNKSVPILTLDASVRSTLTNILSLAKSQGQAKGTNLLLPKDKLESHVKQQADLKSSAIMELAQAGFLKYLAPKTTGATGLYVVPFQTVESALESLPWMQQFTGAP